MRLVCSEHSRSSAWHAAIRSSGVRETPAATDAWKVQEGSPRRGQSQNRAPRLTSSSHAGHRAALSGGGAIAMLPSISAREGSARSAVRKVLRSRKPW